MMLWGDVNLVGSPAETFFEDCARDAVPARRNKNKCHDHYNRLTSRSKKIDQTPILRVLLRYQHH